MVRRQAVGPGVEHGEESETSSPETAGQVSGGDNETSQSEEETEEGAKRYRVLTQNAIIDGVKYSDHDADGGGFGFVNITPDRADVLKAGGVCLTEVD